MQQHENVGRESITPRVLELGQLSRNNLKLTHLRTLEAESIHILREVAASSSGR